MNDFFKQYLIQAGLTEPEAGRVNTLVRLQKIDKKEYFLHEGDVLKFYAFVTCGCLRTFIIDENGNELTVNFAVKNMWVGDSESLESGKPSVFNIDASENSEAVIIYRDDFLSLCEEIPAFGSVVNIAFKEAYLTTQYRIHELISLPAEDRYLRFLKTYPHLSGRIPQAMIASFLRVTPETLSRVRKQIQRK